ncbi:MAG: hypothetical protein SNG27_10905 [Rikenellaceae bacterium]
MIKRKIETQELQNAQDTQRNHIANKPKRKLVSLSDINPSSINKEPESEPLRKINMSDLSNQQKLMRYFNPTHSSTSATRAFSLIKFR